MRSESSSMKKDLLKDIKFLFYSYPAIIFSNVLSKMIGYIWIYLIAKQGPEMYGYFSLMMGFISIYGTLTTIWLTRQSVRNLIYFREKQSEKKAREILYMIFYTVLFSNIFFLLIVFLFGDLIALYIYKNIDLKHILIYISIFAFVMFPLRSIGAYLSSKRKIFLPSILKPLGVSIIKVVTLIMFFYYFNLQNLIAALTSYLIGETFFSILIFLYTTKKYNLFIPSPKFVIKKISDLKELICISLPIGISKISRILFNQTNIIIINYFHGAIQTGIYSITNPFISIIQLSTSSLQNLLSLILTERLNQKKEKEIKILLKYILKYFLIFLLFIYSIYFLYGEDIISSIFGKEYRDAYKPLIILSLAYIIAFIGNTHFNIIWAKKTVKYLPYLVFVGSSMNLILNLLLVPIYGFIGSAIATFVSLSIMSMYHIYSSRKIMRIYIPLKEILLSFIFSVLSLITINKIIHLYVPYITISLGILLIFLSGLVYLLFLFLTKTITIKEIKKIYSLLLDLILKRD